VSEQPKPPYVAIEKPDDLKALFKLTAFSGHEEISRLFNFTLELESETQDIKPEQVVGKRITFSVLEDAEGNKRYFNGFVSRFTAGTSETGLRRYQAEVVPWLWFLTKTSDCRIFAEKKVPDIIKEVFKEHSTDFEDLEPSRAYREWKYCVQYRETDFNFVSRLMEQEGIAYYFKHTDSKHMLVLIDKEGAYQDSKKELEYEYSYQGSATQKEVVTSWVRHYQFVPGKYCQTDYNFEKHPSKGEVHPDVLLKNDTPAKADVAKVVDPEKYEIFDYPGEYEAKAEGKEYTKVYMQEEEVAYDVASGSSVCESLGAGTKFKIKFTKNAQKAGIENGEYAIVSIQHSAADEVGGGSRTYTNSFTCIPSDVPFRPARITRKPAIQGAQTAVVVGPKGSEINTDKYGRIQVQFFWDRYNTRLQAGGDDKKKAEPIWIRVGQIIAGKKWGAMFIPRVGQEVIVTFLEGDPDRPIVTGVVYNDDQMPPYDPKSDATKSYIKTNSSPGGKGYNEIQFEDKAGKEMLYFHAQKNMDTRVRASSMESVGGARHLIVGGEKDGKKGGEQREMVYKDKHLKVHNDRIEHIGGNMKLLVGGIDGDGNQDIVIKKDKKELIEGDNHLHVKGNRNEKVDKGQSLTVGGDQQEKVGKKHALEAGQEIHLKAGMKVIIEAGLQLSLVGPGGFVDIGPAGVTIQGAFVKINSGGAAGTGSGSSPTAPADAAEAAPTEPGAAHQDSPKSGEKSTPF
jgi:type VI secretion system secreted protein VgrG